MIDSIIPKSNPVPQGIFCLGVMFVQLDLSRSRRRRRWWLLPLVPAVLWLCLPRLAAALPAAAARADRVIGARYTARLDALQQENFALHQRLAASADAVAENKALRSLLGSGRAVGCVTPARVLARTPEPILEPEFFYETEGFYSHCVFPTGNVVVDGVLYVYYGGADKYVGVATCRLEELLNYLTEKCRCE